MNDEVEKLLIESITEKLDITPSNGSSHITKLAGDASTRKYYRIIKGDMSYVVVWTTQQMVNHLTLKR